MFHRARRGRSDDRRPRLRVRRPRCGVPLRAEENPLRKGTALLPTALPGSPTRGPSLAKRTLEPFNVFKNKCFKINGIRPGLNSDGVYAFRLI